MTGISGEEYKGTWKDNIREGKGTQVWKDGKKYTGEWIDDQMTGSGQLEWPDGSQYEGEMLEGMRHGEGKMLACNDGSTYLGSWHQD